MMGKITMIFTISLLLILGCTESERFSEFPLKTKFEMRTEDYNSVKGSSTEFLPYLTPYARIEKEGKTVLFGFIFYEEDHIQGVAYLVDQDAKVLDSLNVSVVDPPNEIWSVVDDRIMVLESGGMMEEGPLPPGRTNASWIDTLRYGIGMEGFWKADI